MQFLTLKRERKEKVDRYLPTYIHKEASQVQRIPNPKRAIKREKEHCICTLEQNRRDMCLDISTWKNGTYAYTCHVFHPGAYY